MDLITIGEAVDELRGQIIEAQASKPDNGITFEILEAQLQIQGTFSRATEAGGNGKVKFSVFGLGAEAGVQAGGKSAKQVSHTVTLKLNVRDAAQPGTVEINTKKHGEF